MRKLSKYEHPVLRADALERYHDFLEERVNSHKIGDEFEIQYYSDYVKNDYWDLAEYEDYVEIPYTSMHTVGVKILKHYEIPIEEIYFG